MPDPNGFPYDFPTDANVQADLDPAILQNLSCNWIPDMNQSWGVDYNTEGTFGAVQSWVAPRHTQLPVAIRQLVSWNRERFAALGKFYDKFDLYLPPRPLVPTSVKLTPFLTNNSPEYVAGHYQAEGIPNIHDYPCGNCADGRFPIMLTDKYRLDITWAADEFTNRLGIVYAKVEIEPSLRLESVTGANMGVIPLKSDGTPKLDADPATEINAVTTGFPFREPQLVIKVTYPWVRLVGQKPSIQYAGPIGQFSSSEPKPGMVPEGQYLGCVNSKRFLGFPRGRVLYQSAELVEKVSPVTNRLGYQVTHVFLALTTASWNETRYSGDIAKANLTSPGVGSEDISWPFGVMVATKKDKTVYKTGDPLKPIYPYVHKDFSNLLYYGTEDAPLIPAGEG